MKNSIVALGLISAIFAIGCKKEDYVISKKTQTKVEVSQNARVGDPTGTTSPSPYYFPVYGVDWEGRFYDVSPSTGALSNARTLKYNNGSVLYLQGVAQVPGTTNQFVAVTDATNGGGGSAVPAATFVYFTLGSGSVINVTQGSTAWGGTQGLYNVQDVEFSLTNSALYMITENQLLKVNNYKTPNNINTPLSTTTIIANISNSVAGFTAPYSFSFDATGNLFIYSASSGKLAKYSMNYSTNVASIISVTNQANANLTLDIYQGKTAMCITNSHMLYTNDKSFYHSTAPYSSSILKGDVGVNNLRDLTSNANNYCPQCF